jgi:hypothetical protein
MTEICRPGSGIADNAVPARTDKRSEIRVFRFPIGCDGRASPVAGLQTHGSVADHQLLSSPADGWSMNIRSAKLDELA